MREWTTRDIALWQEDTFTPSVESQTEKGKLEAREYLKARGKNKKREYRDWVITKCWLAYFKKDPEALVILETVKKLPDWEEIQKGINEKMEINLTRTWHKTNTGEWRHVSEKARNNV